MNVAELEDRFAVVDGVRLHYVEAGEGPLVVLLHGFPEFWWSWRRQIPALVEAGFRVVALDMRGYGLSDRPPSWRDYRIERLAADVDGLIGELGEEQAYVVGHDWGAAVAWAVAALHPARVRRLAILNVPHTERMAYALRRSGRQLRRSWYMFFFQIPWLPERLVRLGGRRMLERVYGEARDGAFTEADLDRYAAALLGPGAIKGPIDYYRAALRRNPLKVGDALPPIPAPTLVIWGRRDRHLGAEWATPRPDLVPDVRMAWLPEASHWVQHDEPEEVNRLLVDFLTTG